MTTCITILITIKEALMDEKGIKEFNEIMKMFETSLYALKWLKNGNYGDYDSLVVQNEHLLKRLRAFCINYVGDAEEC